MPSDAELGPNLWDCPAIRLQNANRSCMNASSYTSLPSLGLRRPPGGPAAVCERYIMLNSLAFTKPSDLARNIWSSTVKRFGGGSVKTFGKRTPTPTGYDGRDRRAAHRRSTSLDALIHVPGRLPIKCIVRDISATGACLIVPTLLGLPNIFELKIAGRDVCSAEIVRRASQRIGVTFR